VSEKNLYVITGCNGAGKTTASFTILPEIIKCKEFVNADEIAKGLSPFQPESVSFESGRIMLHRIDELFAAKINFAFETTLSSKIYQQKILKAKAEGYFITLLFFWLQNTDLAKERVRIRVLEGGHHIPDEVVERRYIRGIKNLFSLYIPIVDEVLIFDNSIGKIKLIAEKLFDSEMKIIDIEKYNLLKAHTYERI
jgi:predicted ABC-type ATPase